MKTPKWIAPSIFGLLLVGAWFVATLFVPTWIIPTPGQVFERLSFGLSQGFLLTAALQTISVALLASVLATALGVPIGFAIAHWPLFARTTQPYLAASQAIPAIAIAPLLVLWVGYGTTAIVVLCILMVIFPIIINTAIAVRGIEQDIRGAARLDGAEGWRMLFYIELPLALPTLLAGLRTGFTLSITGAVVGEMVIGGSDGLGIVLVGAQALNDLPAMFAAIFILALSAIGIYLVMLALENRAVLATER